MKASYVAINKALDIIIFNLTNSTEQQRGDILNSLAEDDNAQGVLNSLPDLFAVWTNAEKDVVLSKMNTLQEIIHYDEMDDLIITLSGEGEV